MLYLGACVVIRKPIHFKGMTISLPPFHLSAMQLIVSALDFLLASATLYVLLPPDIVGPDKINFSTALIAYLSAQIVAVITHAPGAVGILEGILLTFLEGPSGNKKGSIISALIMFRVIYYFIPFLVAGLIMLVHEYWPRSNKETGDLSDGI